MDKDSMLKYAYQNIDYYNRLYEYKNDCFEQIPILEKETIQENKSLFMKAECRKQMLRLKTSGSTGKPLEVYWLKNDYLKSNFSLCLMRKKWYGIKPSDSFCNFFATFEEKRGELFYSNDIIINGNNISLHRNINNDETIQKYIDIINELNIVWMQVPYSVFVKMDNYISRTNNSFKTLKYIELNGEYVPDGMLEYFKKRYKICFSNLYGAIEFNAIALTCPYGNMHIFEKNVYVEDVYENGENQLIITSLSNTLMPIIRYRIGDLGCVKGEYNCKCGNKNAIIKLKMGRINEVRMIEKNLNIDTAIFLDAIDRISQEVVVKQFKVFVNKDVIKLKVCVEHGNILRMEKKKRYYEQLIKKHSWSLNVKIFIEFVEDIQNIKNKFSIIEIME